MEIVKKYVSKFTQNLDVIFGLMGISLGILIVSLYYLKNLNQQDIGVTILSSSLIYILFRKKFKNEASISSGKDRLKRVLGLLFYIIFLTCVLLYNTSPYFRPLSYFILICVLAGIIASEILYVKEGDSVISILLQIFLLSILIRVGVFYNFPSLMGYDAYFHANMARTITDTGFVAPFQISGKYFYYPIVHIFISITQIIGKTNIKDAIFYSIGFANIFITACIYLIGKKLEGPQMGLLAALLINLNNHNIVTGIANITAGSLVLCYFIFIIYTIFSEKQEVKYTGLVLLISILIIVTHQLTTFVVLLALVTIYASKYMHRHLYKNPRLKTTGFSYMLFFLVSMQTYWTFTYVHGDISFFEMILKPLIGVLQGGSAYSSDDLIVGTITNQNALETLILHISYLALPFFAIGGVLAYFSREDTKKINKFSVALVVIILYGLAYGVPLLGMRNLLTSRWFPLIAVFLSLVAASFMLKIVSLCGVKKTKIPAIFITVLLFSFVMITTPAINKDNPLVAKDSTVRNQFKYVEIYAIETITGKYSGSILMDSPYDSCLFYSGSKFNSSNEKAFDISNVKTGEIKGNPMVLLRKSTLTEPVSLNDPERYGVDFVQAIPEKFFKMFETRDYALIYNNEEVSAYIKEGQEAKR